MRLLPVLLMAVSAFAQTATQLDWSQIKNKPVGVSVKSHNWTVTPTTNTPAGSNTKTIRCPTGLTVNAWVRISNGSTGEVAKITGGTCNQDSPPNTGTIIFTSVGSYTANSHTISSATAGWQEAIHVASVTGKGVLGEAGTFTVYAALQVPSNIIVAGSGQNLTTIKAANGALGRTPQWEDAGSTGGYYGIINVVAVSFHVAIRDLTVDENGANQTPAYISGDIQGYQVSDSLFSNVSVINRLQGITGVGMAFYNGFGALSSNQNNTIENATVHGQPGGGGGAYYIEGQFNRIINTYAYEVNDTAWVIVGNHHTVIGAHGDTGTSLQSTPMYTVLGSYNVVSNSHCTTTGGTIFSCFEVGGPGVTSVGNMFADDVASSVGTIAAFEINDPTFGASTVTDTTFSNITVNGGCVVGMSLSGAVSNVTISNAHIVGCTYAGISMVSPVAGAPITTVSITGSVLDHNTNGVLIQSGQAALINNLSITGNFIGDKAGTVGSPFIAFGILMGAGTVNGLVIKDNIMNGISAPMSIASTLTSAEISSNMAANLAYQTKYVSMGATAASGSTLPLNGSIFHVSGTAAINIILNSALGASCINLIPDGAFTWTTGGNIAIAGTAVVGKQLQMCFDPTTNKWYPSY